ncbi:ECF RNA polymerase sigma factor SigW [Anaerotignum neopropionicum]|uniref:ECF RNA polymerase sigma factor SigW n=1 Tax=Anaerotignum neopropionicum TaxID=36847 RepID=A0A136WI27_9FIRM|nr:RNA polymerase sigma factor [Anaerotignum neopropionicum]KXL54104.1 ECF RNA polymerase sigma factor SigW [Anaerotignum neopropionicum]
MKVSEVSDLVNVHGKNIYNFCRQLTKNKEDADELYQDTFLKAIELCHRIDKGNNPKSYLLSIAVKLWKNRKRKYAWRERIVAMESYQDEIDYDQNQCVNVQTPEDELLEKEWQGIVAKTVGDLKEEYRIPMYLYYTAELSLKEISRILFLPEGTVKSRLYKARNEVKKYLEVKGYGR